MRRPGTTLALRSLIAAAMISATCIGCATVKPAKSIALAPPDLSRESVTLEKYSVRFAHGDPDLNDEIWREIDEEFIPADLRARLAANGMRGIVGAHLPAALDRVLRESSLTPAMAPSAAPQMAQSPGKTDAILEPKPVELMNESKVRRGLWQTRPGNPGILIMSGEQARIARMVVLLRGNDGRVAGRTYEKVMGILSTKAFPKHDGSVRLEVTPELEHGDPRSRFIAVDGMIKPDYRPETVVFDELQLSVSLAPGQMLVLSGRGEKPGSLGMQLFSEQSPGQPFEQKLILLRLANAPSDDRLSTEIPLARR